MQAVLVLFLYVTREGLVLHAGCDRAVPIRDKSWIVLHAGCASAFPIVTRAALSYMQAVLWCCSYT